MHEQLPWKSIADSASKKRSEVSLLAERIGIVPQANAVSALGEDVCVNALAIDGAFVELVSER